MRSYIEDDRLVVAITNQEACRLNTGEVIADRRNPLNMEAKVEVHPYTDHDITYKPVEGFFTPEYEERLAKVRCVVMFFANTDLAIYVPPEVSRFALISAEHITRDAVRTLLREPERSGLLDTLPKNGVTIRFDAVE